MSTTNKPGKLWFRNGTSQWCYKQNGKIHAVIKGDKNETAHQAQILYGRILEAHAAIGQPGSYDYRPLRDLVDLHIDASVQHIITNSAKRRARNLRDFAAYNENMPTKDLTPLIGETWARMHENWGDSTRSLALADIVAFLNSATRARYLSRNPLTGIHRPRIASRAADCLIDEEIFQRLLQPAKPHLRAILQALWLSGCRPSEVLTLHVREYNRKGNCWAKKNHKTKYKGKTRVIYLCPALRDLTEQQVMRYPNSHLFPGERGSVLSTSALCNQVTYLAQKLDIPDDQRVIPYGLRHGTAVRLLQSGVPDAYVAELLGHSVQTLHAHYSHMSSQREQLQQYAARLDPGDVVERPGQQAVQESHQDDLDDLIGLA